MADKPAAEFTIDDELIRQLLRDQAPELSDRPIRRVATGWDNEIWRIGEDLALRLPRRALAEALIEHEQRWLPELAPRLSIPVPVPVVAGRPSAIHPRAWSIVRWFSGEPLGPAPATAAMAASLGAFLRELHVPAPHAAPVNESRGVPLARRAERTEAALTTVHRQVGSTVARRLHARWHELRDAPVHPGPAVWLHGDLHPLNILVEAGRISAVIDFGDVTSGDPASDLAIAWMGFERPERAILRASLPAVDPATWVRAQAWALAIGVAVVGRTDDDPLLAATARATLERVLTDDVPIV